jgi:hypothetical protein
MIRKFDLHLLQFWSPRSLSGRLNFLQTILASEANQNTAESVGLYLSHSNVTQTTFRPVGLTIFHSGVKGHPDHFWAGRAVSFSFWRRRPPRLLLVRSGKNKKAKKVMAPFGIRTHTSLNAQRYITLTVQTCDVTPLKVYFT